MNKNKTELINNLHNLSHHIKYVNKKKWSKEQKRDYFDAVYRVYCTKATNLRHRFSLWNGVNKPKNRLKLADKYADIGIKCLKIRNYYVRKAV